MDLRRAFQRFLDGLGYFTLPLSIAGAIGLTITVLRMLSRLSGGWLVVASASSGALLLAYAGWWHTQRRFEVKPQVGDGIVRLIITNRGRRSAFSADVEHVRTADPDTIEIFRA